MSESAPYDPQDELRKLLAGAGLYNQQIQQLQPRMALGQQMMQPQTAQGAHVGNTYVASSPLEHLSNAIRQIVGAKMTQGVIDKQAGLTQQLANTRQQYMQQLQTAGSGYQSPGDGDVPPNPQAMQRLEMMGAASGDPAMAAAAHFGLQSRHADLQTAQMQNTMRHQQELEQQGRGRLGISQERVDMMNQQLALRGIRYDPNTSQFVDIRPMAGVGKPPKSLLPRSTGAVAPTAAAPPSAPPLGGAPPPPPAGGAPSAPLGKWQDAALKALGADFNPSSGRSGEFGKNQARLNAAQRLLALAQDPKTGGPADLTPQQMTEVSSALATLIGGGSSGEGTRSELTPHTKGRSLAQTLQWVTDEPHGTGQQAFVQQMIDTAKREVGVAQQGVDTVRGQLVAKHQRILRSNPEEARKVLQGFGWDLGPDGTPVMKAAAPPPPSASSATGVRKFTRQNGKLVEVTDAH